MASMNGWHGLRPHNRKFFYNSQYEFFEPIYYDGNLNLNLRQTLDTKLKKGRFKKGYIFPHKEKLKNDEFKKSFRFF